MKKPFLGAVLTAAAFLAACTVAKTPPTVEQKARDTTSGRYLACPAPDAKRERFGHGMLFSEDGRFAALPQADLDERGAVLGLFDLTADAPRLSQVALQSSPPLTRETSFALSPSAASVLMAHESGASLFELPSGRRVATTTIPPGWRPAAARFPAEGSARVWLVPSYAATRARAEMRVLDLAADGTSSGTTFPVAAALDPVAGWRAVLPDADGRRIQTLDAGLHLRDGATGELIATLVEGADRLSAVFLADGRIVVAASARTTRTPRSLSATSSSAGSAPIATCTTGWCTSASASSSPTPCARSSSASPARAASGTTTSRSGAHPRRVAGECGVAWRRRGFRHCSGAPWCSDDQAA